MMRTHKFLMAAQSVAIVLVAVPALGIAVLTLREVALEPGGMSLNRVFHLGLGLALLLLLVDAYVAIRRSGRVEIILLLGTGGFLLALIGGLASEVLGPPVLLLLIIGVSVWASLLLRSRGRTGPYEGALKLHAQEMDAAGGGFSD